MSVWFICKCTFLKYVPIVFRNEQLLKDWRDNAKKIQSKKSMETITKGTKGRTSAVLSSINVTYFL